MTALSSPSPSTAPVQIPPSSIASPAEGTSPVIALHDLFNIAQHADEIGWQPFRDGVDIHRLYGDGISGPTAALLRYRAAAALAQHVHEGYEHIFVLAGSQRDEFGIVPAGTLRVHPPGTKHSVIAEAGCIVLAIYEKPVRFL